MDRQTVFGFVLIALVVTVWMWWTAPRQPAGPPNQSDKKETLIDTTARTPRAAAKVSPQRPLDAAPQTKITDTLGKYFSGAATGSEQTIVIQTDKFTAEFSNRGAVIKRWTLKGYTTWAGYPIQLVNDTRAGDLNLLFTTTDGKFINTGNLFFTASSPRGSTVIMSGNDEYTVEFTLPVLGGKIVRSYRFKSNSYSFDTDIQFIGLNDVIANYEYQLAWEHGLPYAEVNSVDESRSAAAYSYAAEELTEIDAKNAGETPVSNTSGTTEWVAARNKYFAVALLSNDKKSTGAYLEGQHILAPNSGIVEKYSIALKMQYKGTADETARFTVFLGPLEISTIKSYHRSLDKIMSLGWSWIRPITEYAFIPLFLFLHSFISNWGFVIIVFSIVIKIALHPLTRSSMKSMKKMQQLQPLMQELKEKYKEDPQTMNVQTMKLYKDYGVNPAGGCLPLLLQMPILYALYSLFSASIELRQAHFIWWITDLSVPDVLIHFPFTIPLLGNFLSGLTIMMGITMFIQQKMSTTDPTQKAMIWMMPIMFTIMFNNLPSGLNLYYFVFNLLSIAQQTYINKTHANEPLQKVVQKKKSGGIMGSLTKNLPPMPKR